MVEAQDHTPHAEALYQRFAAMVYRRAFVLLKAPHLAEDMVQEVFVAVLQELDRKGATFDPGSSWFFRVTTNKCLNLLRRKGRLTSDPSYVPFLQDLRLLPDEVVPLVDMLDKLPDKLRPLAVMRHLDGMTLDEMHQETGKSIRTLQRRLAKLDAIIAKHATRGR